MKSRKRQILAAASPKKTEKSQDQDQEVDNSETCKPRKRRVTKESPAPVAKKSKAAPKAKAKATPTGGSKVAKAKVSCKATAKASTRKPKVSRKGKARKSKAAATDQEPPEDPEEKEPKKRTRKSSARQRNVPGAALPSNPLRKDSLTKSLMDFALKFPAECETNETHLKAAVLQEVRSEVRSRPLTWAKLMFYWSRNGCGVKVLEDDWKTYRDHCSFSFNSSSAPRRYRLAVATRCAELAATWLCQFFSEDVRWFPCIYTAFVAIYNMEFSWWKGSMIVKEICDVKIFDTNFWVEFWWESKKHTRMATIKFKASPINT